MTIHYRFAFISRHSPTQEQVALATEKGIELIPIGDCDAFTISPSFVDAIGPFDGVVVVHPAAALRLAETFIVGIFENGTRPGPDDRPQFFAKNFHLYNLVD